MKLLCSVLGHHRSAKKARIDRERGEWVSTCEHCDEPMIRFAHRDWRVDNRADQESCVG